MTESVDHSVETPRVKVPSVPRWEQNARDRVKTMLPKVVKPIRGLLDRDAVEADTRMLVTDVLCDVLGYDKYEDLTAEYQVKGDFADIGIRVDKQLKAFVEIKRVKQDLNKSHLRQVESYALREGVLWAILTNARQWQLYRVEPIVGQQSELNLVFSIDLLDDEQPMKQKVELLYLLCRESIQKHVLDEYWAGVQATSPKTLRDIILSESVLDAVKKELWRRTRQKPALEELRSSVEAMLK